MHDERRLTMQFSSVKSVKKPDHIMKLESILRVQTSANLIDINQRICETFIMTS